MPGERHANLRLLKSAARDLERLRRRDRKAFQQVWEDMGRLAAGALPAAPKPLRTIEGLQVDAGRFRIVFGWEGPFCVVMAVFAKSEQKRRFRGWPGG